MSMRCIKRCRIKPALITSGEGNEMDREKEWRLPLSTLKSCIVSKYYTKRKCLFVLSILKYTCIMKIRSSEPSLTAAAQSS